MKCKHDGNSPLLQRPWWEESTKEITTFVLCTHTFRLTFQSDMFSCPLWHVFRRKRNQWCWKPPFRTHSQVFAQLTPSLRSHPQGHFPGCHIFTLCPHLVATATQPRIPCKTFKESLTHTCQLQGDSSLWSGFLQRGADLPAERRHSIVAMWTTAMPAHKLFFSSLAGIGYRNWE